MKGVKVVFAHDTEVALASAAALVNTGRGGKELLPDTDALDRFVADWGWTGGRAHDQAELDAVRRAAARLERLWEMDEDAAAGLVNTLLREASALPQLVKHDQWDYHLHATPPDAPLADRMAVEAAMAFTDVIRSGSSAGSGCVPRTTARTFTRTCRRTGRGGSAASPAPTAPTSPLTGYARRPAGRPAVRYCTTPRWWRRFSNFPRYAAGMIREAPW